MATSLLSPDQEMSDAPPEELEGGSPDLPMEEEEEEESESGEDDPNENNDEEEILKDASQEEEEEGEGEDEDEEEEEDLESLKDKQDESSPPIKTPKDPRSRKRRRRDKLLQDCLSVQIPMQGATADLGIAMRRTRRKRLADLQKEFPGLGGSAAAEESSATAGATTGDAMMEAVDEDEKESERQRQGDRQKLSSPKKKLLHVPQREDFANVVDYLEAKYVQGVMINDEEDGPHDPSANGEKEDDDDEEGQGSVYSQTSFLDDDDLQRDVAEQVLAQSTTTKLELESNADDAFFVNIGTLEVEETHQTQEGYDPLKDVSAETKKKPKKKRKPAEKKDDKSVSKDDKSSTKGEAKKAPVKKKENKDVGAAAGKASSPKKKAADPSSPKKKAAASKTATKPAASKKKESAAKTSAEKTAAAKKKELDAAYAAVSGIMKSMTLDELPRQKTKEKVAVTCPADKKAGDSIMFANPHFPGQRLKVKIPKNTAPGGTFRVTVPVAPTPVEDEEEGTDHNKWSREFYDAFGEYCVVFDEWVDLVAAAKKEAGDKDYVVYYQKRLKFDQLIKDAPSDLKTPLEKTYMQKLLRRARQNRHKRERTLKRQEERTKELTVDQSEDQDDDEDGSVDNKEAGETASVEETPEEKPPATPPPRPDPTSQSVRVPELVTDFPTVTFDPSQF